MSVDIIHFRPSALSALPFLLSSSFSSLLLLLLLLGSGSTNNRSVHLISPHSIDVFTETLFAYALKELKSG